MSLVVSYEFQCDRTMPQMLDLLRAGTPWTWKEGFSDIWDDWLGAVVRPDELVVRIFYKVEAFQPPTEPGRYLIEIKLFTPDAEQQTEREADALLKQLAPVLGAAGFVRAVGYN